MSLKNNTNTSARNHRRLPPRVFNAEERRLSLHRGRQATAQQIRKQRKEERLHAHRQRSNTSSAATAATEKSNTTELCQAIQTFLQTTTEQTIDSELTVLHRELLATGRQGRSVLQRLLEEEQEKAVFFVRKLITCIKTASVETTRLTALEILLEVVFPEATSSSCVIPRQDGSVDDDDENYYGASPLSWPDLLLQNDSKSELFSVLLSLLTSSSSSSTPEASMIQVKTASSHLLGNLIQYSPSQVLHGSNGGILTTTTTAAGGIPVWTALVTSLPASSYVVAAILIHDATSPASIFLQTLTPQHILMLLQCGHTPSVRVEAAWMLEGLTRREEQAVGILCNHEPLIRQLMQCLEEYTTAAIHTSSFSTTASSSKSCDDDDDDDAVAFLVPALRAIGNMAIVGSGAFAPRLLLLSSSPPSPSSLVTTLVRLLEHGIVVVEAMITAALFFPQREELQQQQRPVAADAAIEAARHASLTVAIPAFLPPMVRILVSDAARFEWKRHAILVLNDMLLLPHKNDQVFCESILKEYFWNPQQQQDDLIRSLLSLISNPNVEVSLGALEIANLLLRIIPESRKAWREATTGGGGGVDCLEQVCHRASSSLKNASQDDLLEHAANFAADLLDDFFENDGDDDNDNYYGPTAGRQDISPVVANNQFVFGAPTTSSVNSMASPTTVGRGRGRGRALPAWMQQQ